MERKERAAPGPNTVPKADAPTKRGLTGARKQLVELMQNVYFGRIEQLVVQNGEPVLEPRPRIIREIKIGGENALDSDRCTKDFLLRSQVRQFFLELLRLGDGVVQRVEVKHGLPFRVIVETPFPDGARE